MEAFSLSEILADKEGLFPSFASSFNSHVDPGEPLEMYGIWDGPSSRMLLRIQAKADYFTHDKNLMSNVPPVPVHVILDPFHFNVLPHSLLLTVFTLLIAAIVILSLVVYALDFSNFNAWRSKGGIIMNAITLGEPDRDGDSDGEDGVGLFGVGMAKEATRSVSRGRRTSRNPWGSAVPADTRSVRKGQEAQKALARSSSATGGSAAGEEGSGSQAHGRGASASARGRGKSKGRGRGGKKGRKKRR